MSKFLFEFDIDNLVNWFSFCMQAGANPNNLLYVLAPSTKIDLPFVYKIVGLVEKNTGNYHIPTVDCTHCGITECAIFLKKGDSNFVSCSQCSVVCYQCILQLPTQNVVDVVLYRIDPNLYPM